MRLEDLGFRAEARGRSSGSSSSAPQPVLVTGPTASARPPRSTRLHRASPAPELNIVTIEDPVEYGSDLINQTHVHDAVGLTFARAVRRASCSRAQDVIMVGEIRDEETARVAVQAALTGHLVLATLHTNDAPGGVARLAEDGDRGLPDARRRSTCVVAQRLARQLCTYCKQRTVIAAGRADRGGLPSRRRRPGGVRAGRLRALQPHRLPRPDRPVLGDADERRDQGA